jgi:hypothetical protein
MDYHLQVNKNKLLINFKTEMEILLIKVNLFIIGRNFKKDTMNIVFLPANENHTTVFKYFIDTVEENSEIYISNRTFRRIWKMYLPEIKFLTPRSDLCHICKEHRFNASYWMPEEKEIKIREWNDHILWATKEHEYYRYINNNFFIY